MEIKKNGAEGAGAKVCRKQVFKMIEVALTDDQYYERYFRAICKLEACITEAIINQDERSLKRLASDLLEIVEKLKDN